METTATTDRADAAALEVRDLRTERAYRFKLLEGTLPASNLRSIKADDDDFGLLSYDPGYGNTVSCQSAITFVDGERGILEYRGYPIQELAASRNYTEITHLLIDGALPDYKQLGDWNSALVELAEPRQEVLDVIAALPASANPMSTLMAAVASMGAVYEDAREIATPEQRHTHALRLLAQLPVLASAAFRRHAGLAALSPQPSEDYVSRLVDLLFDQGSPQHHAAIRHAVDVLLTLHADHEQNCSTSVVRAVASSEADPYSAMAAGVAALSGPLHGGANEAVLRMLQEIGSPDRLPGFLDEVREGRRKLMGFGHRVYKTYDPRARIIKQVADEVFDAVGKNPLIDLATQLETVALADDYFVRRHLYPNVDFYSGLIYEAIGLPVEMFPVMFAVARTSGWAAHWLEFEADAGRRIARPRQIYTGPHDVHLTQRG